MISVIDYGRGNLYSIGRALSIIGHDYIITKDPEVIARSSQVLVPGVGAFGDAMAIMRQSGISEALSESVSAGHSILGICLGMQLLATKSFEFGEHTGLNFIPGKVSRLAPPQHIDGIRIPNIGWRKVDIENDSQILKGLNKAPYFYFIHSYSFYCTNHSDLKGTIHVNGEKLAAIISRENVWGFQFHPEKSGPLGLTLLDNFFKKNTLYARQS